MSNVPDWSPFSPEKHTLNGSERFRIYPPMGGSSDTLWTTVQAVKDYSITGFTGAAQVARVALTRSDILNLHVTPIEIIPAPGSGKIILVLRTVYDYTFGTTPYSGGGSLYTSGLFYTASLPSDNVQADNSDGNLLTANDTSWINIVGASFNGASGQQPSELDNSAVCYWTELAPYTAGDGTMVITAYYFTMTR